MELSRHHGRNGRIYLQAVNGTGVPEPLPFQASWSINQATDRQDVTAFGDQNKTYVAGFSRTAPGTSAGSSTTPPARRSSPRSTG